MLSSCFVVLKQYLATDGERAILKLVAPADQKLPVCISCLIALFFHRILAYNNLVKVKAMDMVLIYILQTLINPNFIQRQK